MAHTHSRVLEVHWAPFLGTYVPETFHRETKLNNCSPAGDGRLLAVAAHEIKNSLTALNGATQMLLRRLEAEGADPQTVRLARMAVRRAGSLRQLADELLDLHRSDLGRLPVELQPTDVARVLLNATEGFRMAVDSHPLDCQANAPHWALADPRRLEQIVENLLSNAAKFSPIGAPISARAAAGPGEVRIEVRDRGAGVPSELRERIFAPFFQKDSGSPGLGLGLSLSREFAERMGGRLWHEPVDDGPGSRFHLSLRPCHAPDGRA